jgi:hypothetical protein
MEIWREAPSLNGGQPEKIASFTDIPNYTPENSNRFDSGYMMGSSNSHFTEETSFYVTKFGCSNTTDSPMFDAIRSIL